jgi:hypothetical protein
MNETVSCLTLLCTQFLLEIDELAGLSQRLEPWRRDVYAPLIIEVGHAWFECGTGAGTCTGEVAVIACML